MDDALRKRLVAFYAKYNPVRLQSIDQIIESWRDDEEGLFAALREKYHLRGTDVDMHPSDGESREETNPDSVEYVPPNLTPVEQLEYRCQKMEKCLSELFASSKELPLRAAVEFKDNAAAFSEISLGVLRDIRLIRQKAEAAPSPQSSSPAVMRYDQHISSSRELQAPAQSEPSREFTPLVHDVMPLDTNSVAEHVLSTVIRTKCRDGDILNIFPGKYRDNITISGLRVSLQAASSSQDRPVVLMASDDSSPILQINENSSVQMNGISFSAPEDAQTPLVVLDGGSVLSSADCTFIGGGGGILLGDTSTRLDIKKCSLRGCSFAGVYVKTGAALAMDDCQISHCEVGVRIRDASAKIDLTRITESYSDGVTFHGNCKGEVSHCSLVRSKENGAMLSPSSTVSFLSCDLKSNGQFGIYVPAGAEYVTDGCSFSENVMGPFNRPPPMASQLRINTVGVRN